MNMVHLVLMPLNPDYRYAYTFSGTNSVLSQIKKMESYFSYGTTTRFDTEGLQIHILLHAYQTPPYTKTHTHKVVNSVSQDSSMSYWTVN